jgi:DNA polymerase-3 subunit alpha
MTKKNEPMAFFHLADPTGQLEVLAFPKVLPKIVHFLEIDNVVEVTGRLQEREGSFTLIADDVKLLPKDEAYQTALSAWEQDKLFVIHMQALPSEETLLKIKEVLEKFPGFAQVYLAVGNGGSEKRIKTKTLVRVDQDLTEILKSIPEILQITTE